MTVCGYCGDPLPSASALDDHLHVCEKRPRWLPGIGLKQGQSESKA